MPVQTTSVFFLQESHRFLGIATILNPQPRILLCRSYWRELAHIETLSYKWADQLSV